LISFGLNIGKNNLFTFDQGCIAAYVSKRIQPAHLQR
jgi:hypothetical protein